LFGFALSNRVKSNALLSTQVQSAHALPAYSQPANPGQVDTEPLATRTASSFAPASATATPRPVIPTATSTLTQANQSHPSGDPIIPVTTGNQPTPTPASSGGFIDLDPSAWKTWPVMPVISDEMKEIYHQGLARGNDPHAFSILGDCQSLPEVFMGVFDEDPALITQLPETWRETAGQFRGSFNRYSPTVKDGTTEGALLWGMWNDNKEKRCEPGEPPLECELRVHRPSIVFVHVGTHWEARNRHYLTIIIENILEHGAVPIMVTKADNREQDERVNENYASLAAEYNIPLWNFWASVQNLPDHGMEAGSDMYLSPAGLEIHRTGALQALDAVWRAVR